MKTLPNLFRGVAAPLLLITLSTGSFAANLYWDATTSQSWGVATNWSTDPLAATPNPAAAPGAGDVAIFNAATLTGDQTVNLGAARAVTGLSFTATSGPTTFISGTGGATNIVIGSGGIVMEAGAGAVTFGNGTAVGGVPVRFSASQTWTNNSGSTLSALNTVGASDNAGAVSLTVTGSGNTLINNNLNNGSVATDVLSVTKTGAGTLTVTGTGNYSGATTISGGVLSVRTIANGGTTSGLGAAASASGNLVFDGGTLDYAGTAAGNSNRGFNLNAGGGTLQNNTAFTANFSGVVTGTGDLTKTGTGAFALSGTNDYTGKTTVSTGTLSVRRDAALGASGTAANGTEVASGATLVIDPNATSGANANLTLAESITLNGATLQNATRNNTLTGPITLNGTSTFQADSGTTLTVSGVVGQSSAGSGLLKTGAGTVVLSNSNTYTGVTTVTGGILRVGVMTNGGVASSIGSASNASSNIVLDGGRLEYNGGVGVGTDRGFTLGANGGAIGATANTLRIDGIITGAGDLTKTGGSVVALTDFSGINNYTGRTIVQQGTLAVRSINALGASGTTANGTVVETGGTLLLDPNGSNGTGANVTWNEVLTLNGGTVTNNSRANTWTGATTVSTSSTIGAAAGSSVNFTGAISGAADAVITKNGAGTVIFSSTSNSYTGTTRVSAGVLSVTGNINSSTALEMTATFSMGASNIIGDTATVTFGEGALLQTNGFSDALGVLAVTGNATLDLAGGNSIIVFADSSSATWTGVLALTNWSGLDTGGGPDQVVFNGTPLTADQISRITVSDATGVYSAIQLASGEIVRGILIPEPSALLLSLSGLALALRRRRK